MSEDNKRETREIKTPSGHAVEIKTYFTPREDNEVRNIVFASVKYNPTPDNISAEPLTGEFIVRQEQKLIELCVLSIDGNTDNIVNRIMDGMKVADYKFILEEIQKSYTGNLTPAN